MPMQDPNERYVYSAIMVMLSLTLLAAVSATFIHWLSPVHQPMDMIVPPVMCVLLGGLIYTLRRRPEKVLVIARIALMASGLALVAPSWLYPVQAAMVPDRRLTDTFPPIASLLLVLMAMVMIFFPTRQAIRVALLAWVLIALPVLVYLVAHPAEMWTPRGKDLLMTYGPEVLVLVALLPVQWGLSGKIRRLVSERSRMESLINRDPLTQTHSRRHSEETLRGILGDRGPAGVIMFDMDRFKAINDTYGHPVGDRVLQVAAKRCLEVLRRDESISRWGGEEFVVIVPNIDITGLQHVAERLRWVIAHSPIDPVARVTASFGFTVVRADDDLDSLIQRVDQALYQAKERGGNCVVSAQMATDGAPVPVAR